MAISALPQTTIHLLGSAQALTTPTSLVKELVDNSIDAHATSIDILISPNTIDKIEVRDNGHGIAEDDLDALGRRGHTSKLRTFEDLKAIGGISLGFRGEALASAVQLGEVSVITRTDGQQVASSIKIKTGGGIASQSRVSHPIGTTVSVAKFMFKLPVRKHKFEVEATKTLAKIKDLLRGYALARPHIRFGLKVTKGGKGSWSYAPRPNDGMKEAVSQILDRNLAAQCVEKTLTFAERHDPIPQDSTLTVSEDHESEKSQKDFVVEAFLPKPDADPTKIGFGQWISIDSRPVAHDKGTMRRIVTLFKYYVKNISAQNNESIKTPFLRLNIRCPDHSYDPNVEPAKDDVLFANEPLVLESIEGFFKRLYGDGKSEAPVSNNVEETANDFNILLARKPSQTVLPSPQTTVRKEDTLVPSFGEQNSEMAQEPTTTPDQAIEQDLGIQERTTACTKRKWGFDMSEDFSEDIEGVSAQKKRLGGWGPSPKSTIESTKSSNGLNPWLIAKLNLSVRNDREETDDLVDNNVRRRPILPPTPERSSSPLMHNSGQASVQQVNRPRQTFHSEDIGALNLPPPQHHAPQGKLHASFQRSNIGHRQQAPVAMEEEDELLLGNDSETYKRRTDFVSARQAPAPEDSSQMPAQVPGKARGPNKPFISPMRSSQVASSVDSLRQTTLTSNHASRNIDAPIDALHSQPDDGLAWAMDYENRKDSSTRRRREEFRAERPGPELLAVEEASGSSPHKNRYNAAIADLEKDDSGKENPVTVKETFQTTLPDGDARAYLMRRQKSMQAQSGRQSSGKLTRAKSMRLPLETVPNPEQLHNVLLRLPTSVPNLLQLTTTIAKSDAYVSRGIQAVGLAMSSLETTLVATRIEEVVEQWMTKANPDEEVEVLFNFQNLVNDKFR